MTLTLCHSSQRIQPPNRNQTSLLNQTTGVLVHHFYADCSIKEDAGHHRLVEYNMQHLTADTKGPELPEEKQAALVLLIDSISVK